MKSRIFAILLACLPPILSAQTTLDRFLQKMDTTTFRSQFTITIADNTTSPQSHAGRIAMRGKTFYISVFNAEAAYDGKTLSVYSVDSKEMTISTPTEEELLDSNPILYARALKKACTISEKTGANQTQVITLVPKDQSAGIQRFILTLRKDDLLPVSLEVKEGAQYTKLNFRNARFSADKPRLKMERKGATIIDLR